MGTVIRQKLPICESMSKMFFWVVIYTCLMFLKINYTKIFIFASKFKKCLYSVRQGLKKKSKNWNFPLKGVGVRMGQFSTKKNKEKEKKGKTVRMVQFIQKTQDLNILLLGGSGQIFGLIVRFNFNFISIYFYGHIF